MEKEVTTVITVCDNCEQPISEQYMCKKCSAVFCEACYTDNMVDYQLKSTAAARAFIFCVSCDGQLKQDKSNKFHNALNKLKDLIIQKKQSEDDFAQSLQDADADIEKERD